MMVRRFSRTFRIGLALALAGAGGMVLAQIEGGDRGVAPIDSSGSLEVSGVQVDVRAKEAESAREAGWRLAQRKGWSLLSQRLTGRRGSLPDSTLNAIVTGIVVENEQIGPNRYIARLGVLFDRQRAGAILGVGTLLTRSPPLLVIPVQWSGGVGQVFERATPWQQAWARFRTGNSSIDYVRPSGTGPDPLLLNVGQTGRRGRGWWRTIIGQYGASDVVIPEVRLFRTWPGGPVIGAFRAGYGPDNREITRFSLRVESSEGLPALLDAGVARIDQAYQDALRNGILKPDRLLSVSPPDPDAEAEEEAGVEDLPVVDTRTTVETGNVFNVQFDTPSVAAVASSEAALRAIPGVSSAATSSLALGGVSVMRVTFSGDINVLRAALEARGWQVQQGERTLRIRRAAPARQPAAPAAATDGG